MIENVMTFEDLREMKKLRRKEFCNDDRLMK